MNNEIKEILDFKENADYKKLSCDEIAILKDNITNLQQENEELKKLEYKFIDTCGENESFTLEEYLDIGNKLYDTEREKENYKSRIEKAVEYIKEHTFQEEIGFDNKKGEIHYGYFVECKAKELLDILNGKE